MSTLLYGGLCQLHASTALAPHCSMGKHACTQLPTQGCVVKCACRNALHRLLLLTAACSKQGSASCPLRRSPRCCSVSASAGAAPGGVCGQLLVNRGSCPAAMCGTWTLAFQDTGCCHCRGWLSASSSRPVPLPAHVWVLLPLLWLHKARRLSKSGRFSAQNYCNDHPADAPRHRSAKTMQVPSMCSFRGSAG